MEFKFDPYPWERDLSTNETLQLFDEIKQRMSTPKKEIAYHICPVCYGRLDDRFLCTSKDCHWVTLRAEKRIRE